MHFAFSFAAQAAEVEVNTLTGEVRVLRVISANDVGKAINPLGLQGQVEGGVMMGLGNALTENFIVEEGRVFTDRLARYRIPSIVHTPEITSIVVEHPVAAGPYGAKGVGEIVSIPTTPAITNAIYNAIGVRVDRLPVDQAELVRQLAENTVRETRLGLRDRSHDRCTEPRLAGWNGRAKSRPSPRPVIIMPRMNTSASANQRLTEIAAEIISEHTGLAFTPLAQIFQAQIGYATPRVDVRGAVFQDGKLLLVRERQDGGWTMPGGWADVGDVPSEAAEREVWEEAGFRVKARKLVGVYDANRLGPLELFHAFKLVFLCELIEGEARPSSETSEVAFFSQNELPGHPFRQRAPGRAISWMLSRLCKTRIAPPFSIDQS